jgi:peroxiredoxin family protein/TusA-related sulfurtransferase/rhodanese-related sulfurtransferase
MATIIEDYILDKGVKLTLKDGVKEFKNKGNIVVTQSGKEINTDMIILAIGVKPENILAKEAGLSIGERGGIIVKKSMQTSNSDIYALGDAVETTDFIFNAPAQIPLAWPANRQARIVADHINGIAKNYLGTVGTAIVKVFDMAVAVTGFNEKQLKAKGEKYIAFHLHPKSHAGYYPGATNLDIKFLMAPVSGKILGAQIIGTNGVDKRIDVISTAIKAGLTAPELQDLELAYAPPFSSAKDPINYIGYIAENILNGSVELTQWNEVDGLDMKTELILDVGEIAEREVGYIDHSINIPLGELRSRFTELDRNKTIHVYCQIGLRGYIATRILRLNGYKAKNISGGYKTYIAVKNKSQLSQLTQIDDTAKPILSTISVNSNPMTNPAITLELDACGLQCPGPILQVKKGIDSLKEGEFVQISATDPAFAKDVKAWCSRTGHILISTSELAGKYTVIIQKGSVQAAPKDNLVIEDDNRVTLIVFSGDLDKSIASFIIANGSRAFGKEVSIFFTFWGLNILRKPFAVRVNKTLLEKMFGFMMPRGVEKLGLSRMNMLGIGPMLIKYIMRKKNVDNLTTQMDMAIKNGVKLIACSMSMDIMGIKKEELIEGVEIGGVATYLADADQSKINLFI